MHAEDNKAGAAPACVILKKGEGRTLKSGGLWVYDNEIASVEGDFEEGGIVRILDFDGYFLGWGFINTRSRITCRLMSRREEHPVNEALIRQRVFDAWAYRKSVLAGTDALDPEGCCRLIFGEADFLPGITIDRFAGVLVVESLALGIERFKLMIIDILKELLARDGIVISGVYERSDAKVRLQEGMERVKGFIGEPFETNVGIVENGIRYLVDVEDGQKTGFFLDQKFNRRAVAGLCAGKEVLDCFTHTGSFALNAAGAGAASVLAVDASERAIAQADQNAALNGFENVRFMAADVFDLLPQLEQEGRTFDVVILDPPAFTKSRNSIKNAVKGYREINMRGLRLVRNGGFLATCSCSHFMDRELFEKTVAEAARSAHKRLRQVECRTQACDHPILWANDASFYLKFYIFQVVEEI